MKTKIKDLEENVTLYTCKKTGIAFIENGKTGTIHSCHASIDSSGSVRGMKKLGYWLKKDRTVKTNGFIFNIDSLVVSDELDEIARKFCKCGGKHQIFKSRTIDYGAIEQRFLTWLAKDSVKK